MRRGLPCDPASWSRLRRGSPPRCRLQTAVCRRPSSPTSTSPPGRSIVGGFERVGDRLRDRQRFVQGDRSPRDPIRQRLALDQLHDQCDLPVRSLDTVDGCDVRMIQQPGAPLRLADAIKRARAAFLGRLYAAGGVSKTVNRSPGGWSNRGLNTRQKRGSWTDQRLARDKTIHDPVKSGKPPSPVQIRAALQFFAPNSIVCAPGAQTDASQLDYGGLQIVVRPRVKVGKPLIPTQFVNSSNCKGRRFGGPPP